MDDVILKVENVSKFYPGVTALDDISLEIRKGEVRALVGENGAGKSTLIKCIMGVEKPDKGKISLNRNGEWVTANNAIEAKQYGMHANYQSVNIARELSIAENYYLGRIPKTKAGAVDWKTMNSESKKIIDRFDLNVDPRCKISELPVAMQAMVTISKISVNEDIRLVIFDEPTALLENEKVETLFKYMKELKAAGVSIIYISHRLEEVIEVCDSVTIMKDGKYVDTLPVKDVTKDILVEKMVGREMTDIYNIAHATAGEEVLRVEGLSSGKNFSDVSFDLKKGEILGFFGLVGAGRSEVMRTVFGVDKRDSGKIFVKGKEVSIKKPKDALKNGIGFMTEDRRLDGLAMGLPIKTNIVMSSFELVSKGGFLDLKKMNETAEEFREKTNIKTPSIDQLVSNLSGGNQQKVVVSKLLCREPDVLIFDEPTVGVDVGAKEEIYKIMEKLVNEGKSIILISSYLPEVMGLSDRMVVMSSGKVVGMLSKDEINRVEEADIMKIASAMDA